MRNDRQNGAIRYDLPQVHTENCTGCGRCAKVCYRMAISFEDDNKASIFRQRCPGIEPCGRCLDVCDHEAITTGGN
jgi:MinD superfamily P-loop ATPase